MYTEITSCEKFIGEEEEEEEMLRCGAIKEGSVHHTSEN
jgi:hypothetical protein